ncbi:MAG: S41 family peptidase [Anaerolineae bacterium]|nr:S41 family peptidase [Anaerolineae bacterium]
MKIGRTILFVLATIIILVGAFSGGLMVGWSLPGNPLKDLVGAPQQPTVVMPSPPNGDQGDVGTLFAPFWETWDIVHDQYVDQPVDDQALMRGAIDGMLASLGDPHTSYMNPDEYDQATTQLTGEEYEGIGAWVDITGEYLTIVSPMPKSPAEKAGIRSGDKVIAVDDEDVTGMDGELVLQRILGPAGTEVKLTVEREGEEQPLSFAIVRAKITVPTVDYRMETGGIAYIRLFTYGDSTSEDLRAALTELMAQNPQGMILDLRNNGGGYLNTAIEVISEFIDGGKVAMYEESGDGTRTTLETTGGGLALDVPLVVLVNEGTASASEITAGAIQDYGRGELVGVVTYGKGSVQNWIPLSDEQGAVRVTIARWLTPNGRQINQIGLEPDYTVELTDEDIQADRDPQLAKALALLTQ